MVGRVLAGTRGVAVGWPSQQNAGRRPVSSPSFTLLPSECTGVVHMDVKSSASSIEGGWRGCASAALMHMQFAWDAPPSPAGLSTHPFPAAAPPPLPAERPAHRGGRREAGRRGPVPPARQDVPEQTSPHRDVRLVRERCVRGGGDPARRLQRNSTIRRPNQATQTMPPSLPVTAAGWRPRSCWAAACAPRRSTCTRLGVREPGAAALESACCT